MFTKLATLVDPLVRKVEIIRDARNEKAADRIMEQDPCTDEIYTYIDGEPVTYRDFNRRLRKGIREARHQ